MAAIYDSSNCLPQLLSLINNQQAPPGGPGAILDARDGKGRTPAMLAARRSHAGALGHLLRAAAAYGGSLDGTDADGNTLLHHCCLVPDDKAASAMVEAVLKMAKATNINVSQQNKQGKTPLHLAASTGNYLYIALCR